MTFILSKRQFLGVMAGTGLALAARPAFAAGGTIRIAVLKTGTVNWELNVIRENGLDKKHGFTLDVVEVANNEATRIALQAGDVDVITSDWLLVARERGEGSDLTFVPFSSSVGSVMVPGDSPIKTLADLKGKRVGVAGGPLDKNWLLLQGLAKRDFNFDLAAETSPQFGAPPLLSEKLESGELDAALTFWNFAARLEAKGFRTLISGEDAAIAMGAKGAISAVGYVFSEKWATENLEAAKGFVAASREAKQILKSSDAEWERIRPLVRADDDPTLHALRDRFRQGIPSRPVAEEVADAETLFKVLADLGGPDLVGKSATFAAGTYWTELSKGS
ncbi:ABC transporter substrate-binding protein [Chthonobacter rhizosphaerae]|uniref:ABC transporter substrate-binding protein n=1 Tax=Chthonobacter rhizosphaerae TaxID=2735553 RepID=UPI0015EF6E7C|nr:ABC transporter substrate-binding protein [Chthonobacter rhizosphaerae]